MEKEVFLNFNKSDAIIYIAMNYDLSEVEGICEEYVKNHNLTHKVTSNIKSMFSCVAENLEEEEFKEFLYDNVISK